ncbi:MAG: DUF4321 domain-containing protein [Ruminococcus sp.]|nr:DUF4321 domain-containing protein [Ruminococcus sp.]
MKQGLYMSFLMLCAVVIGGFIGGAIEGTPGLGWLGYSKTFAFEPGTFIDIDIFRLTFGVSITISIAQLILMVVALIVYYNTAPKLISGK